MRFLLLLFLVSFHFSFSQNLKGYYITQQNDTIKAEFDVVSNFLGITKFDPQVVRNKIKVVNEKEETRKFKPNEIKSFFISDTKSAIDYKFVSILNQEYFYHEIINGKLSYYKVYFNNSGGALGALASPRLYLMKNNELVEINPLNLRKGLAKQIMDYPELYQKWMDSNKYYKLIEFEEVIKLYNEHFK